MSAPRLARPTAILLVSTILASCASYTPTSRQVVHIEESKWQVADNVAAAADAYLEAERQKTVFDADLTEANVIAIQLAVENKGAKTMLVRNSDVQLVLADGRSFAPSGVHTTVARVGESGSVVGAGLAFGLIGVLVASNAESKARIARTADYSEKAFTDTYLANGERGDGVVFFIPSTPVCKIDGATLKVRFVEADTAKSMVIDVPLPSGPYGKEVEVTENAATNPNSRSDSSVPEAAESSGSKCAAL